MRRRVWYVKYALALLASAAVTFHLLYAPPRHEVRTHRDVVASNSLEFGKDVETQWVQDVRQRDASHSKSAVEALKANPISAETFPVEAGRNIVLEDVVTQREGETHVLSKIDAKVTSKGEGEALVETQMKSGIEKRFETFEKNDVNQKVSVPHEPDVGAILQTQRTLDAGFHIRKQNDERPKTQNAVTKNSDVDWATESMDNELSAVPLASGYAVSGNVTIHVGDVRIPLGIHFLDSAPDVCEDLDLARRSLLIFVASSVEHSEQRQAIRDTWGLRALQVAYNFRVVFLLGKPPAFEIQQEVEREKYRYGDVVQLEQEESFRHLGLKSVAGLKWSRDFCGRADLVMKTDDDILVHVPNLLDEVGRVETDELLMCRENGRRRILRKELLEAADLPPTYRKYQVSEAELPGTHYPPYCSGMAYVFSAGVRDRLLDACSRTPVFFVEDVHVTGFCRHKAGIRIRHHPGIALRPPIQTPCSFKGNDRRITSQELDVRGLRLLWAELNTRGFFCPQEMGLWRHAHPKVKKTSWSNHTGNSTTL